MIAILAQLVRRVVLACAFLALVVLFESVLGGDEWRERVDALLARSLAPAAPDRYRGPYDDPRQP